MEEDRRAARWRKRRVIFNNDGDDVREAQNHHDVNWQFLKRSGGELMDDFLAARTTSLMDTQVDSIWYSTCSGGLWFSHDTKLGGFFEKGISRELIDTYGRDDLQIQVDFCHEHDREVFWSLRVNDNHDAPPKGYHRLYTGLDPFKQDHPHCLMGEPEDWDRYPSGLRRAWTSLDFSYPEVREHIFSLIEEVCQGYDVDGVELDFLRDPVFFAPTRDGNPVELQHVEMMTDLVRRVKRMTEEVEAARGRPLLVAARTPFTVADARFVGLDLQQWLAEDLVDVLIAGQLTAGIMTESLREIVDLGHRFDVPVYPCVGWCFWCHWAFLDLGAPEHPTFWSWVKTLYGGRADDMDKPCYISAWNSWGGTAAAWRGAATNAWGTGADGIYVFNGFHSTDIDTWREIGEPKTLANGDKVFGVADHPNLAKSVELELKPGERVSTAFQVGEKLIEKTSQLKFRLHLWEYSNDDDLEVRLNGDALRELQAAGPARKSTTGQWLECQLQPRQVRKGENLVELLLRKRDESIQPPIVMDAVQLHVRHT